jgi:hypothetical protein
LIDSYRAFDETDFEVGTWSLKDPRFIVRTGFPPVAECAEAAQV